MLYISLEITRQLSNYREGLRFLEKLMGNAYNFDGRGIY